MKKEFALADALNIEMGPTKRHKGPQLSQIGAALQRGIQRLDESFVLIPTGGRPLDYDYGTDALLCRLTDETDRRRIARGELPYVALGVTTRDKDADRQSKKASIPSDIEILFPDTVNELQNLMSKRDIVPYLKEIVHQCHKTYQQKSEGGEIRQSHFIDYRKFTS